MSVCQERPRSAGASFIFAASVRSAGTSGAADKPAPIRRIVPSRIADALTRETSALEEYISRHLEYPLGFPYKLTPAAVLIREFRTTKATALATTDLPPVRVEVLVKTWLANRAVRIRGDWDPGVLDADVLLTVRGTVTPTGTYNVEPRSAALKAWWRDVMMVESRRLQQS